MMRRLFLATLILALAAAPAAAGSVTAVVRDQDGRPVAKQRLVLREASRPGPTWRGGAGNPWRPGRRRGTTGSDGRFTFPGVGPGSYAVELQGLVDPTLVRPADSPFLPTPEVTLFDDRDQLEVVVELWRGVRVNVALVLPDDRHGSFRAVS